MPRGDSTLKKIVNQLVTMLTEMTTVNGYATNMKLVTKQPSKWSTFNELPAAYISYSLGGEELLPNRHNRITEIIRVMFKYRDDGTNPIIDQVAETLTDLRYMLSNNHTLRTSGGEDLVVLAKLSNRDSDKGIMDPEGWLRVGIEVTYHVANR